MPIVVFTPDRPDCRGTAAGAAHCAGLPRRSLSAICQRATDDITDSDRDLVIVTLVEVAPFDTSFADLADRAMQVCFHGEAEPLGQRVLDRAAENTPQQ